MSEEFWNNKISVGYYDKLHTSGLKKGERVSDWMAPLYIFNHVRKD